MGRASILDDGGRARDAASPPASGWRAFAVLVAATHALIVLGALVRVHGAGLACPDWPLCFGQVIPAFDFEVAFEWTHRVLAGSVALGFAGLATWSWRRLAPGDALRRLLVLAGALLVLQVLLGALTVWQLLASWTVTSHLLVGNSIAASFAWLALELRDRERGRPAPPRLDPGLRRALVLALALLAAQLVLGGQVSSRYAGPVCPEWPACAGGEWFPSWSGLVGLHLLHRLTGYALLAALLALAWRARGAGRLARWCAAAAALGLLQVAVGVANVLTNLAVEVTGLHSFLATALVLVATGAAREAWRSG